MSLRRMGTWEVFEGSGGTIVFDFSQTYLALKGTDILPGSEQEAG
jgi:hypothetical protein